MCGLIFDHSDHEVILTISQIIKKNNTLFSIFPGSRKSELDVLTPILIDFIKLMNNRDNTYFFVFHATEDNKDFILNQVNNSGLDNIDVVSDENIKSQILSNSIFAVSKSGTVSLQIASSNIPSIIIYKLSY